ncbi:TIGR01440 family protein [Ornithinibacillus gellani]|uniref:TIGR01440 family protein n=1 Tax=Ornithinibacillus gellani TaxID=2293253 RepID=UPI000F4A2D41|nr:TIGR01440 family protein [Ornithinibacillus gellani]
MTSILKQVEKDMNSLIDAWVADYELQPGQLFVIGCSTSEVAGKQIGTAGSEDIAAVIYKSLTKLREQTGIRLVFQCCEHLNRALVMERQTMEENRLEAVYVIPVPEAGGSMASFAYKQLKDPVVVETVQAHAGIDIGETMIGMQLKPVAVPLRFAVKQIGNARLNGALTRPKRIGGARAVYA